MEEMPSRRNFLKGLAGVGAVAAGLGAEQAASAAEKYGDVSLDDLQFNKLFDAYEEARKTGDPEKEKKAAFAIRDYLERRNKELQSEEEKR